MRHPLALFWYDILLTRHYFVVLKTCKKLQELEVCVEINFEKYIIQWGLPNKTKISAKNNKLFIGSIVYYFNITSEREVFKIDLQSNMNFH